jgi:hypothetical protein
MAVFGAEGIAGVPGVIAGAPGVTAGAPGLIAVPLPCCGIAVELFPGVTAVLAAPEPGAGAPAAPAPAPPEPACA